MAVRTSMENLIGFVRRKIYDPAGKDQIVTDLDIQNTLDEGQHKLVYRYAPLTAMPVITSSTYTYNLFMTGTPFWEADATLWDIHYVVVTPDTSDFMTGVFGFTTPRESEFLYIVGNRYRVYNACAQLLLEMMHRVRTDYDVSTMTHKWSRMQKFDMLEKLVREYERLSEPICISSRHT